MARRLDSLGREAGIVFSYLLVSMLILFPLLPHLFSQLPYAGNGDVRLSLTILFSNLKKITTGELMNIYQLPMLFPLSNTLTAGINLFGQTLLALPFYLAGLRNAYFTYNLLTIFCYVAAGYCAYRFVREWVAEHWIAWLAGALYILLPFRVHNIPQLNLMFSFPIPLALLFFSRFLKSGRIKDMAIFFAALLSQFLFDLSMGIFLAVALGIFFLLQQVLFGLLPRRSWLLLVAAAVLFALALALVFSPYLSPKTSFSMIDEITAIPGYAFHSGLSFYNNWSYLLLFFQRIVWHHPPFSPGVSLFIFFLLAFVPHLESRAQKAAALCGAIFLLVPALAIPFVVGRVPFAAIDRACGWTLRLFLMSLALLLFLIRKKAPRPLLLLAGTWLALQFFSSQASPPFLSLFQGLARLFPFLLRTRFIRSEYILTLLFFAVAAFGFSYFFSRFRKKRILLALALVVVFAERLRWPVIPAPLENDRPAVRVLYRSLAPYPVHFGLLELPVYPLPSNHYPLFTIYHDKHTYHGLINYLGDSCELAGDPRLNEKSGFAGLADESFVRTLRANGLRLILVFRDKIFSERNDGQKAWLALRNSVRLGESRGLYEKVERNANGILLVLKEGEPGPRIRYMLPYFSLRGKRRLVCTIAAHREAEAEFLFNDRPVKRQRLRPGEAGTVAISLDGLRVNAQFNYLEIRSGPSLELVRVRIE